MTFYPINKPTEPGWYWFRISSRLAQPFPLKVTIEEGELWGHSVMPPSPGTPFKARVEKFVGQWYGPKIEPPIEPEPEKKLPMPATEIIRQFKDLMRRLEESFREQAPLP